MTAIGPILRYNAFNTSWNEYDYKIYPKVKVQLDQELKQRGTHFSLDMARILRFVYTCF